VSFFPGGPLPCVAECRSAVGTWEKKQRGAPTVEMEYVLVCPMAVRLPARGFLWIGRMEGSEDAVGSVGGKNKGRRRRG